MGKKPKPGQRVRHNSTGQEGVVVSVFRGIVTMILPSGKLASAPAGTFSKVSSGWGCAVIIATPTLAALIGGSGFVYSWAA